MTCFSCRRVVRPGLHESRSAVRAMGLSTPWLILRQGYPIIYKPPAMPAMITFFRTCCQIGRRSPSLRLAR